MTTHEGPTHFDTRFIIHDVKVGLILSFMAIAFGLAIASISNFPLMAGIVSAVVGGLIGSVFGRSPTSIYGAAAALAPILAGSVHALGRGDETIGYAYTLAVIFTVGLMMVAVGHFRIAKIFASFFSHAVISGTLASIAVILLMSRFPMFLGTDFKSEGFDRILELPSRIPFANTPVFTITIVTFLFLAVTTALKSQVSFLKRYPGQLWAIPLILGLSICLGLAPEQRINLPNDPFEGLTAPDFSVLWTDWSLFLAFLAVVIKLFAVDTAETVATVIGIGRLDQYKREPDVDKTVKSMGVANLVGSLFGGMSNIPGGAKSTMATTIGAQTAWTGIICVAFVIVEVTFGREIINLLPQAGLAAIIVFTVLKLAGWGVWRHFYLLGRDQFAVFLVTFGLSVYFNDILFGMVFGFAGQILIAVWLSFWASHHENGSSFASTLWTVLNLMWDPLWDIKDNDDICDVHLGGVWLFFQSPDRFLKEIPHGKRVRFHIGPKIIMIDADTMARLLAYAEKHGMEVIVCESLKSLSSDHKEATKVRRRLSTIAVAA